MKSYDLIKVIIEVYPTPVCPYVRNEPIYPNEQARQGTHKIK